MSYGHGSNLGWVSSRRAGDRWPGVLLHADAFVVRADAAALAEPPGDLVVRVGAATRSIAEILLIAEPGADEWPEPSGPIGADMSRPAAIPVKSVTAAPDDWCTIFWWLC